MDLCLSREYLLKVRHKQPRLGIELQQPILFPKKITVMMTLLYMWRDIGWQARACACTRPRPTWLNKPKKESNKAMISRHLNSILNEERQSKVLKKRLKFQFQYILRRCNLAAQSAVAVEYADCISVDSLSTPSTTKSVLYIIFNGEHLVLELWGMCSTLLLPGPLWPGVIVLVQSIDEIELFNHLIVGKQMNGVQLNC